MPEIPAKQGVAYEKGKRTSPIGNISRTMARN